ncbi:MAG: hypothetical protein WAT81_02610 [Candidatus Moraniibacteriota bacterium]
MVKKIVIGVIIISVSVALAVVIFRTTTLQGAIGSVTGPGPNDPTGPHTVCTSDSDCWCKQFSGAKFYPGRAPSYCQADHRCVQCLYE